MKKRISLTEAQLHNAIKKSVKKILKESRYHFDNDAFRKWKNETKIPVEVVDMVKHIADKVGCKIRNIGEIIEITNRGGQTVGYGKGFTISYCTSSNETGPTKNYAPIMKEWLKGLGFSIENSYGDNGMDSATNYGDTYWCDEFIYDASIVDDEEFIVWDDEYESVNYDEDEYDNDMYWCDNDMY